LTYSSISDAIEAYRLFVIVLRNPNSCRLVCKDGKFEIELVEILAESVEFDTVKEIWDDPIKDANGNLLCQKKGVRLFAQEALAEASSVQIEDEVGYSFMMVEKGYQVARHTCSYNSASEIDDA